METKERKSKKISKRRIENMSIKLCGVVIAESDYLAILDIMKRNNETQIIKQQVIHFVKSGWYALNKAWYNQPAQKIFNEM